MGSLPAACAESGAGSRRTPIILCKAGSVRGDGESLCRASSSSPQPWQGDCPFAHSVLMTCALKNVAYEVKPLTKEEKPEWLLSKHGGSMPCVCFDVATGEGSLAESLDICKFIDEAADAGQLRMATAGTEPAAGANGAANSAAAAAVAAAAPPLSPLDAGLLSERIPGLFGAIARFLKNTDAAKDAELRGRLEVELGKLETELGREGGLPFLGGARPNLADCMTAPKLWVLAKAGLHFKGFSLGPAAGRAEPGVDGTAAAAGSTSTSAPPAIHRGTGGGGGAGYRKVAEYMERVFSEPAFVTTCYPEAEMYHGWGQARGQ